MIADFLSMCFGTVLLSFLVMLFSANVARLVRDGLSDD